MTIAKKRSNKDKLEKILQIIYESFSDVGESWVWLRADFQSGFRVLKKVFWTFSYLYLWHTMWFHAKKLLKTLKFWKSLNLLWKSGSRPQNHQKKAQKKGSQNRESQQGRVTTARSWPLFREKKNHLGRCCKKPPGRNFDLRAKSSWEKIFNIYKNGWVWWRADFQSGSTVQRITQSRFTQIFE